MEAWHSSGREEAAGCIRLVSLCSLERSLWNIPTPRCTTSPAPPDTSPSTGTAFPRPFAPGLQTVPGAFPGEMASRQGPQMVQGPGFCIPHPKSRVNTSLSHRHVPPHSEQPGGIPAPAARLCSPVPAPGALTGPAPAPQHPGNPP